MDGTRSDQLLLRPWGHHRSGVHVPQVSGCADHDRAIADGALSVCGWEGRLGRLPKPRPGSAKDTSRHYLDDGSHQGAISDCVGDTARLTRPADRRNPARTPGPDGGPGRRCICSFRPHGPPVPGRLIGPPLRDAFLETRGESGGSPASGSSCGTRSSSHRQPASADRRGQSPHSAGADHGPPLVLDGPLMHDHDVREVSATGRDPDAQVVA